MKWTRMQRVIALVCLSIGVVLIVFGIQIFLKNTLVHAKKPTLVPVTEFFPRPQPKPHRIETEKRPLVYGFLPYWNIKKAQLAPQLTHVAYFSLSIDEKGNIVTKQDGGKEPGWNTFTKEETQALFDQAQQQQQNIEVTLTMMDSETITAFLSSTTAQQTFLTNVKSLLKTQPIKGINIDIEYAGEVNEKMRTAYTRFLKNTYTSIKKTSPQTHISIDVFADAAAKERIWDIPSLVDYTDHIVVMAYDFYRSSSPQTGPVAPIFGSEKNRWDIDISKSLKAFIEVVPSEKILLGVPFYGYEWQTTSETPGAHTYPNSGGLATYKRVQQLLVDLGLQERWDQDALSPYVVYMDRGKRQMIFYENARSLAYKLDLVNEAELGGIAIWALGYEGEHQTLWEVIGKKL